MSFKGLHQKIRILLVVVWAVASPRIPTANAARASFEQASPEGLADQAYVVRNSHGLIAVSTNKNRLQKIELQSAGKSTSIMSGGFGTVVTFESVSGSNIQQLKFVASGVGRFSVVSVSNTPTKKLYLNAFGAASAPISSSFAPEAPTAPCGNILTQNAQSISSLMAIGSLNLPEVCESKKPQIQRAASILVDSKNGVRAKLQSCMAQFKSYSSTPTIIEGYFDAAYFKKLNCSESERSNFDQSNETLTFGKEFGPANSDQTNSRTLLHELLHSSPIVADHEVDSLINCCLDQSDSACRLSRAFDKYNSIRPFSETLKKFVNGPLDRNDVSESERLKFLKTIGLTVPDDGSLPLELPKKFEQALKNICKKHDFQECKTAGSSVNAELLAYKPNDTFNHGEVLVDAANAKAALFPAQPDAPPAKDASAPTRMLAETPRFSESGASAKDLRASIDRFRRSGDGIENAASGFAGTLAANIGLGSANAAPTRIASLPMKYSDGSSATRLVAYNPDSSTILQTGENKYIQIAPVKFAEGEKLNFKMLTGADVSRITAANTATARTGSVAAAVARDARGVSVPQRLARSGNAPSELSNGDTSGGVTGGVAAGPSGSTSSASTSSPNRQLAAAPASTQTPASTLKRRLWSVDYTSYSAVQSLYREVERANANPDPAQNPSIYFTYCGTDYFKAPGRTNYLNLDNRNQDKIGACRGRPRLDVTPTGGQR